MNKIKRNLKEKFLTNKIKRKIQLYNSCIYISYFVRFFDKFLFLINFINHKLRWFISYRNSVRSMIFRFAYRPYIGRQVFSMAMQGSYQRIIMRGIGKQQLMLR